jgi:hypothetical protein
MVSRNLGKILKSTFSGLAALYRIFIKGTIDSANVTNHNRSAVIPFDAFRPIAKA